MSVPIHKLFKFKIKKPKLHHETGGFAQELNKNEYYYLYFISKTHEQQQCFRFRRHCALILSALLLPAVFLLLPLIV